MSRWLGLFEKNKEATKESNKKESAIFGNGLEARVMAFVDELIAQLNSSQEVPLDSFRSLIVRAIIDAEQVAAGIKIKAQKEAEKEAANILEGASQEAINIIESARLQAEEISKEAEAILRATEMAKLLANETEPATRLDIEGEGKIINSSVSPTERESEATIEIVPVENLEKAILEHKKEGGFSEAAETRAERPAKQLPPEETRTQNTFFTRQQLDRETIYDGEIDLVITVPVDPAAVTRLYNYLQSTPDVKVLYTRGSWERGTVITVTLDKPLPIIGMISKIPGLSVKPGLPQEDNSIKGSTTSLLGVKRKEATKIGLILKIEELE